MSRRGVVLVKNVPHGFYEKQMYDFFSQFGDITRLRLIRSRKTTKSKGIAFIEFVHEEVAQIVAQTMDNYLMFERILKCKVVPPDQLPQGVFRSWKKIPKSSVQMHKTKVYRNTISNWDNLKKKRTSAISRIEKKLNQMGIKFKCVVTETTTRAEKGQKMSNKTPPQRLRRINFARLHPVCFYLPKFTLLGSLRLP
ncbi:uncharacterized protein LOC141853410 [Brevipalpus obovatus]|uniref:uncharacterized protein LOC141853410 n=1 Tax=Brevipalpus obovatus TaxID=246614 RepID=UPI003D9E2223